MTPNSIKVKQGHALTLDLPLEQRRGGKLISTGEEARPLPLILTLASGTDGGRGEEGQELTRDSQGVEREKREGGKREISCSVQQYYWVYLAPLLDNKVKNCPPTFTRQQS
jgi:hypothetical protein